MDWKILYRGVDGAERAVTVKCNQLPNLKRPPFTSFTMPMENARLSLWETYQRPLG